MALTCCLSCCAIDPAVAIESEIPKVDGGSKTDADKAGTGKLTVGDTLAKAHELFSAELGKYVTDRGVKYSEWKLHPEPLKAYLHALSKVNKSEYEQLSQNEKLVYWINAYNAYTIKLVLDHYPIKGTKTYYPASSIRQVDGFWEDNSIELAGKKVTLESMEHDILRRDFLEPRTHFAVVCAAWGCAPLNRVAFNAAKLDEQLDNAAKQFLSDSKNVKIDFDKKTISVSSLFKWFPLDFASVVGLGKRFPPPTDDEIVASYILSKTPAAASKNLDTDDLKGFKVRYEEYDWGLNDSNPVEPKGN